MRTLTFWFPPELGVPAALAYAIHLGDALVSQQLDGWVLVYA